MESLSDKQEAFFQRVLQPLSHVGRDLEAYRRLHTRIHASPSRLNDIARLQGDLRSLIRRIEEQFALDRGTGRPATPQASYPASTYVDLGDSAQPQPGEEARGIVSGTSAALVHSPVSHGPSASNDMSKTPPSAAARRPAPAEPTSTVAESPKVPMSKPIRLPNGNASRDYSARLDAFLKIPADRIEFLQPWPDGLAVQPDGAVQGIPVAAGEHVIPWRRRGEAAVEGELHLTINADPRSLWKDLPSDRSNPFWKPDTDQRQSASALACVAVGSVRGRSHAHVGSFRDDDFGMHLPSEQDPHGWHLLCVADGAGSAKSSRRGSQVACRVVIEKLREMLVEAPGEMAAELDQRSRDAAEKDKADGAFWARTLYHVMGTAAGHAQAAVRKEAEAAGTSIKDFSTTLLVAIVRRTTQGAWFVGTYWVGDGAIGMWKEGWAAPKLFGEPETGEFAGQTTFFTSEDFGRADVVHKRLRYTLVEDFDFLALMTDGISDAKFATEQLLKAAEPWAEFQADLGGVLADLSHGVPGTDAQLLRWMDFWSAGNHDDRTLLLMTPRRPVAEEI